MSLYGTKIEPCTTTITTETHEDDTRGETVERDKIDTLKEMLSLAEAHNVIEMKVGDISFTKMVKADPTADTADLPKEPAENTVDDILEWNQTAETRDPLS